MLSLLPKMQGNVHSIYYKEALFIGKQNEIYRYNEQTGNFDLYYTKTDEYPLSIAD